MLLDYQYGVKSTQEKGVACDWALSKATCTRRPIAPTSSRSNHGVLAWSSGLQMRLATLDPDSRSTHPSITVVRPSLTVIGLRSAHTRGGGATKSDLVGRGSFWEKQWRSDEEASLVARTGWARIICGGDASFRRSTKHGGKVAIHRRGLDPGFYELLLGSVGDNDFDQKFLPCVAVSLHERNLSFAARCETDLLARVDPQPLKRELHISEHGARGCSGVVMREGNSATAGVVYWIGVDSYPSFHRESMAKQRDGDGRWLSWSKFSNHSSSSRCGSSRPITMDDIASVHMQWGC